MKGDFTRSTFRARKHYASVRMQQGRVQVDADWNEQQDIAAHLDRTAHLDIIGAAGVPIHAAGFGVTPTPDGRDLVLSTGRMYIDGILCELEEGETIPVTLDAANPRQVNVPVWVLDERPFAPGQWVRISDADQPSLAPVIARIVSAAPDSPDGGTLEMAADITLAATAPRLTRLVTYTTQPDDPEPEFTASTEGGPPELALDGGAYLVTLDVWERHITALDDPMILPGDLARLKRVPALAVTATQRGGHCGFFDRFGGATWIDREIVGELLRD